MKNIDKFKAKGINSVICVAVNDPYTMNAWAEKLQAKDVVRYFTSIFDFFCIIYTLSVCKIYKK
jgi:peroxiredoxin